MPKDTSEESPCTALTALQDDERAHIEGCAKAGYYPLLYAENGWHRLWMGDRDWTPEMEAYRELLIAPLMDAPHLSYPLDPTAQARGMSLTTLLALRGD